MKKVIVLVVVLLLCLMGCSEQYSASVWGGDGVGVRVGNITDANRVEIGLGAFWRDGEEDPESFEIYAIRYSPEIVKISNPFGVDLPDVSGRPYFGVTIGRDFDEDSTRFSPITGISLDDFLFTEYDLNRSLPIIGIKRVWRF